MTTRSRILVVDDHEANVRLLERILDQAGFSAVRGTTDPREVETLVTEHEPDLLLLDLRMPHIDGFAMLERLAEYRDRQGYLPVLVLTADADPAARHRALGLGATDYVTKPFDADEVLLRCRNLLRARHLYRSLAERNSVMTDELLARAGELRHARSAHDLVLGALNRLQLGAGLDESAKALVDELSKTAEFDAIALLATEPDGGATVLAVGGLPLLEVLAGEPIPRSYADGLRERWSGEPWGTGLELEDARYAELADRGGLRSAWYVPIREAGRTVGLLSAGSRCEPADDALAARLPLAVEFGSIARALLGAELRTRYEQAEARQKLITIVDKGAFWPVFQPVVDIRAADVIGYEALTRFTDGARPDLRFGEGQRVGVGLELEDATLTAALKAARELPASAWLSVNVSPELLLAEGRLAQVLADARRIIVVEITEHVAIDDYGVLRAALESLGPNVRVAIDDAGAGFASFRHVLEIRPDFVKLDADLVRGINADTSRQALVVGMRYFAQQTGCTLIAEGVETEEERAMLEGLGVAFGQGYLFSRPMRAAELALGALA